MTNERRPDSSCKSDREEEEEGQLGKYPKPGVTFVALDELVQPPPGPLAEIDAELLVEHAASRGLQNYQYGQERHRQIRALAEKAGLSHAFLEELDRNYNFIYWMARKVRVGTINSISGMCYDIALKNYDRMCKWVEERAQG